MKKEKQDKPDLAARLARLEKALSCDLRHSCYDANPPGKLNPEDQVQWWCEYWDSYERILHKRREREEPECHLARKETTIQERLNQSSGRSADGTEQLPDDCHRMVIRVNGRAVITYWKDGMELPPVHRWYPCKCGSMDVVVSPDKAKGMLCARCGAARGCPDCAEGPGNWRLHDSSIECGACGADYMRQDPPPPSRPLPPAEDSLPGEEAPPVRRQSTRDIMDLDWRELQAALEAKLEKLLPHRDASATSDELRALEELDWRELQQALEFKLVNRLARRPAQSRLAKLENHPDDDDENDPPPRRRQ
jgi:hypothetical protein